MATFAQQLRNKDSDERSRLKAQWFAELPTRTFTRGEYSVTLSDFKAVDKVFSVFVVVVKDGVEVLRDTFQFINPPLMVPDGTFHEEVTEKGTTIQVPNYREDPIEALKQVLIEAIKRQLP